MATLAPTTRRRGRALAGTGGPTAALFLVPFFAVFALAMIAPVIYSLVLSFHAQQKSGLGFSEPVRVELDRAVTLHAENIAQERESAGRAVRKRPTGLDVVRVAKR